MSFLTSPTPILFFTGKGGVGKTSTSCATAVALARRGRKVLLISTDPASNLDETFAMRIGAQPTPVAGAAGLSALRITDRLNFSISQLVTQGKQEIFSKTLPSWSIWLAAVIFSFGLTLAIFHVPGMWRRVVLWLTTLFLISTMGSCSGSRFSRARDRHAVDRGAVVWCLRANLYHQTSDALRRRIAADQRDFPAKMTDEAC
ncbi:MAG: ArsA family ATPase [Akkermansiaceae bacterium]|nr:ArsA family ATPase [Akkermansiaceae bacterium]